MSEQGVRLFFACALPRAISALLFRQIESLGVAGRFPHPDDLHLTLVFLGALPRKRMDAALRAGASLAGAPGFSLKLDRFGAFARSGVVWAGPSEVPAGLTELQARLSEALAAESFSVDGGAYQPHVTLLRGASLPVVVPGPDVPAWDVDRFALYESHPGAGGPRYRPLAAWPLS